MNVIIIGIILAICFVIQYILTFIQMNNFKKIYKEARLKGRVVIGRKKGALRAGAIALVVIDSEDDIIDVRYMQGATVFARFKSYPKLVGYNINQITGQLCDELKMSFSLKTSLLDGISNYNKFKNGEEIPEPKSPIGTLADKIKKI